MKGSCFLNYLHTHCHWSRKEADININELFVTREESFGTRKVIEIVFRERGLDPN